MEELAHERHTKKGGQVDEDLKDKALHKFGKNLLKKHRRWQMGEGAIRIHENHPLADIKPREQFLTALDNVLPEVKEELDETARLVNFANPVGDDWGEFMHAIEKSQKLSDARKEELRDLRDRTLEWAKKFKLAEEYWLNKPAWMLDRAINYLRVAPQGGIRTTLETGYKEWLTREEKRAVFVFEESLPIHSLNPSLGEAYIESTLRKWRKELEERIAGLEPLILEKYGPISKPRKSVHFDWLALHHVLGYSAETIAAAYTGQQKDYSPEAIRKGVRESATMCSLIVAQLPPGPSVTDKNLDSLDAAKRLGLL